MEEPPSPEDLGDLFNFEFNSQWLTDKDSLDPDFWEG